MDSFTSKKWFVYLGDHHEGPFSLEEIETFMSEGRVTPESYSWAEGMDDWKVITEIPEFEPLLTREPALPLHHEPTTKPMDLGGKQASRSKKEPGLDATTSAPKKATKTTNSKPTFPSPPHDSDGPTQETALPKPKRKLPKWILILLVIAAAFLLVQQIVGNDPNANLSQAVHSQLLQLSESFPFLQQWISPIAELENISPEDYEELKRAARNNPETQGAKAAIALLQGDPVSPVFYLASNLPDGTNLRIDAVGIPDTLLNQTAFKHHLTVPLVDKLAKTQPMRAPDGSPIPKGEYKISVSIADSGLQDQLQGGAKPSPKANILLQKTMFLGGKRDETYASRLKDFHDKLRAKALNEINENKQFESTLESQLNSTVTKFNLLRKGKLTPKLRKEWEDFHAEWSKLETNLNDIFSKWTPEMIDTTFHYSPLYQLTQQTGQAVQKVHLLHHSYFSTTPAIEDIRTYEIQLGEAVSSAQSILAQLKAKLNQAEALPPTPSGMPQKLGN